MGKRNTSSFLAANDAAGAAQERAAKALRSSWARMRVVVRHADADEESDSAPASGYMERVEASFNIFDELPTVCLGPLCAFPLSVCESCEVGAKEREDEGADAGGPFARPFSGLSLRDFVDDSDYDNDRYLDDWDYDEGQYEQELGGDLEDWSEHECPFTSVNEAKMYARLGAPAVRGRMRYSAILRLSMKFS